MALAGARSLGGLILQLTQRVPARIGLFLVARMRSGIEVSPAFRAQTLTVFTAQCKGGSDEKPLLPDDRTKVDLLCRRVQRVHIRIVGLLASNFSEDDVCFVLDVRTRVSQTAAAFERDISHDPAVPIKSAGAGRRVS